MATNLEQAVTQNVKCSICLDYFNEPKLLPCSHTFCLVCLDNLYKAQRLVRDRICCPQCREYSYVRGANVHNLQTNVPLKSIVEDFKIAQRTGQQICTNCDLDDKPLAETYCQECEEYMCVSCHQVHAKWKKNVSHKVSAMADIKSGKSPIKKRRKCMIHRDEEEQFFCVDCNTYVCFRCRVLKHDKAGHHVIDTKEHENNYKKNIKSLQQRAEKREMTIRKYMDVVKEQRKEMKTVFEQRTMEINHAYEESVQQLNQRRDRLLKEYKEQELVLDSKFESLEKESCKQITSVSRAYGLVGNGMKATPEGQALTVQNSLCHELEDILGKDEPDCSLPKKITGCAEGLKFKRHGVLELGSIENLEWEIKQDRELPKKCMNSTSLMPDGRIAVGYGSGGIQAFSVTDPQETVLKDVEVRELSFLSDGHYVLCGRLNDITLYTPQCEKVDVEFDTLSFEKGGYGGLCVDKDDYIYSSYRNAREIHVFKPTGGKAVRVIRYDFRSLQIFTMKSNNMMVMLDERFKVRLIDQNGTQKYDVTKAGVCAYPTVCQDNTILIAWVKHKDGLFTIERYSHELKYMKTLVTDYKIEVPEKRKWYKLQEFSTGEIAFCTPTRLYIFHRLVIMEEDVEDIF